MGQRQSFCEFLCIKVNPLVLRANEYAGSEMIIRDKLLDYSSFIFVVAPWFPAATYIVEIFFANALWHEAVSSRATRNEYVPFIQSTFFELKFDISFEAVTPDLSGPREGSIILEKLGNATRVYIPPEDTICWTVFDFFRWALIEVVQEISEGCIVILYLATSSIKIDGLGVAPLERQFHIEGVPHLHCRRHHKCGMRFNF